MRRASVAAGLGLGLVAAGCFQAVSNESGLGSNAGEDCTTCRRTTAAGGASGGTTRSAASSSSGGSSPGGSSSAASTSGGGGSTGAGGSSGGGVPTGGAFDAGPCDGYVLTGLLQDSTALLTGSSDAVAGANVSAIGLGGVPISGASTLSDSNGQFGICITGNQAFTTQIQAATYVTTYVEDMLLDRDFDLVAVPLSATETISAYSVLLNGFDPSKPVVVVQVASLSQQPPCNDMAGWSFSATLPDGGAIAYENAYIGTDGLPHVYLTATEALYSDAGAFGAGFLFNVDPTAGSSILVNVTRDGGASCPANGSGPFTGEVVIAPNTFSFAPLAVP